MQLFRRPLARQKPSVGLDVGSVSVRVVGLRRTRHGWALVAAGEEPLTDSADVRAIVHGLLDSLELRRVSVAVAVPAGTAIVRRLRVRAEALGDLDQRIGLEAEQHMPAAPGETSVSYQLLDRTQDHGPTGSGALDVLLGMAKRSQVAERASFVSGRGRRVAVADVEGLALANAFTLNYPDQSDSALLLHVGHRSTVACLLERGDLIATRGIGIGGAGFPIAIGDLISALREFAASERPGRLFISGGSWQKDGLLARLASEFSAPAEPFDPMRRIHTTPASRGANLVGPPFAVAVGLALRRKGDQ